MAEHLVAKEGIGVTAVTRWHAKVA